MRLSDLLFKYNSNSNLIKYIDIIKNNYNLYTDIEKNENSFILKPTSLFLEAFHATKIEIEINCKYEIIRQDCGCLQFHKNNECIHIILLYLASLMVIDYEYYLKENKRYETLKQSSKHKEILNKLSNEIKITNPYYGIIHLIPVIEENNNVYELSLKIGADKDYVIKNINEFFNMTENNIFYSYGQKLEFIHSYECLDNVSKILYNFLSSVITPDTVKTLKIRKPHLLNIFEIYNGFDILFKDNDSEKPSLRHIIDDASAKIVLDNNYLKIVAPNDSKLLISGINNAYFIDNENIYAYHYTDRMEAKIYDNLFRLNGNLMIDVESNMFISKLLPIIKNKIEITNEFYEKYPIPDIKINSYFTYQKDSILLTPKISCKEIDRNSPYIKQMLDGYFSTIELYDFKKTEDRKYILKDIEKQYSFLTTDISSIKAFGNVFFDENMKNVKTKKSTKARVNITYNVGLLDFNFDLSDVSKEELKAMLEAYHEKKKFIKLKNDTILEIDEDNMKELDDFMENFNISINELDRPIKRNLNYVVKLISGIDTNVSMDDEVIKIIKSIQNYKKAKYEPLPKYKNVLREYQIDGFKWLSTLAGYGFGGILADDMGLGKTFEIISFLDSDNKNMPSLIVCPMSLVYNWENECEKWKFNSNVNLVIGSSEEREAIIKNIDNNKKALYITSYDSLRRDQALYGNNKFRFIVADEAQFIKNQFAQKSEAIKSLNSEINFALTGTPIENGLADLWSIFDFLMPGYLSSYSRFKNRYESLILHDDIIALNNLKKRVAPFILRRTKKDVLKDLPDKIEDYYYCKMEHEQKEVYDGFVQKLKEDLENSGQNVLALLTRLRQVCITPELIYQEPFSNTKINMAVDLIKSSIEAGHRILLFSQFSQSFPIISRELEKMNIRHFILDGQTKAKSRIEMVDEFNQNEEIKVFIISLKAGGTGLNLIGADMVIHLDPWWNNSAEVQATDRTYRIGQTKNVTVIKLICKDTIEEKVIHLQSLKKELAEAIVVSDELKPVKLTKKDILELLE